MTDTLTLTLPEPVVTVTPERVTLEWSGHGIAVRLRIMEDRISAHIDDERSVLQLYDGTGDAVCLALIALRLMDKRSRA